ncbi:MAG: apolipoprotein N-acyltransferase [Planctomycetes bacterium]|nr:apolipoprotein N-acyltransferase [Planctomycetota bacterium]
MEITKLKKPAVQLALFAVSAFMLTFIQVPHTLHFLAWVALVPFVLACRQESKTFAMVLISGFVATVYWLGNLWWLTLVTVPGYIGFCIYLGLYWPILAICIRYCRRKRFPLIVALPVLIIGAEAWQGILITGFSWRLLGHSQYANTTLIQFADIFGATGVSFVVAMVNGLICDLIIDWRKKRNSKGNSVGMAHPTWIINAVKVSVTVFVLLSVMTYGKYRIGQSAKYMSEGPVIGSVQPNIPSYVKELADNGEDILNDLIDKSNKCFDAGAELVAWPETIVLATMNKSYTKVLKKYNQPNPGDLYNEMISKHTMGRGYVFFGSHAATIEYPYVINNRFNVTEQFNSAYLYRPDGKQDPKRFDKIHLVPFGEYIPCKKSAPFIYKVFRFFSPFDYDYSLTRGTEYTAFDMDSGEKQYHFGCLICYEDTDPEVTRKMVVDEAGNKKSDWLINISNDGWYVKYDKKSGKMSPSGELSQRTAISVFRAIENRISIIRSVNTGISCLVDPVGRIVDGYAGGDLPQKAMDRECVEGWFVDKIFIDKRVTFFSKHGKWPDIYAAGSFVAILAAMFLEKLLKSKYMKRKANK